MSESTERIDWIEKQFLTRIKSDSSKNYVAWLFAFHAIRLLAAIARELASLNAKTPDRC